MSKKFEQAIAGIRELTSLFSEQKNARPSKIKAMKLLNIYFSTANLICSLSSMVKNPEQMKLFKKLHSLVPDPSELIALFIAMGDEKPSAEKALSLDKELQKQLNLLQTEKSIKEKKEALENNLEQIVSLLAV